MREAIRRLAAEGLVDLVPRQGARVSRVSPRSVRDLFDFRMLLEPEAMRQATTSVATDPALRRTLSRMRADFERLRQRAPSPARSAAFYALADRFDWRSSTPRPTSISAGRSPSSGRTRPGCATCRTPTRPRIEVSVAEHLRMVDAVLDGDGDGAAAACADHLAQSVQTIFRALASGTDDDLDVLAQ